MKTFRLLAIQKTFIGTFLAFSTSSLWADPVSINPRPRMESMGHAGLATDGDEDSAMVNPAALNEIEKGKIEVFPLLIEIPFDVGNLNSLKDFNDVRSSDTSSTADKQTALTKFLRDVGSSTEAIRVNFYPSYTRKHFHIGLLADFLVDARMHVGGLPSDQAIDLGGSNGTAGLILGTGYSFFNKDLEFGVTLKPIYRMDVTVNEEQTVLDILQGKNSGASVGDQLFGASKLSRRAFAIGTDIGIKYSLPILRAFKPTIGLTWQDVGGTKFFGTNSPDNISQSLSIGAAAHLDWGIFRNTFALDLRNLTAQSVFWNKIHFGFETLIWHFLAIRGGISQSYFTGGVGLITKFIQLDAYVTAQEAALYAHMQPIRTLGVRVALGF